MLEGQSKKEHEIIEKQDVDIEAVEEETVEAVKEVVIKAMKEEFSGPIPHPDTIRKYEEILPGAADRIISMAERQALHRQEMERKMITAESRDGLLGVVFCIYVRYRMYNCGGNYGMFSTKERRCDSRCIIRSYRNWLNN